VRLESNIAPRILTVSENWITESSNLTEDRLELRPKTSETISNAYK